MEPKHYPNLETLDFWPSWVNNAGAIDRSACVEVRVSTVRRLLGERVMGPKGPPVRTPVRSFEEAFQRSGQIMRNRWTCARVLPDERPARNRFGRQATAIVHLRPEYIACFQTWQLPRRLAGDYRDGQANAMRPVTEPHLGRHPKLWSLDLTWRENRKRFGDPAAGREHTLPPNPNRGSSRTKITGLPGDWYQPLRLERWRYPKRVTPMFYFVCPGIHPTDVPIDFKPASLHDTLLHPEKCEPDPRLPGLSCIHERGHPGKRRTQGNAVAGTFGLHTRRSTRGKAMTAIYPRAAAKEKRAAAMAADCASSVHCTQRVLFLLLPLCTPEEARDARIAQLWIQSLTPHQRSLHQPFITRLIARYGILFHPRTLVCRNCLRVAYGKNPVVMAKWRRKRRMQRRANQMLWVERAEGKVHGKKVTAPRRKKPGRVASA